MKKIVKKALPLLLCMAIIVSAAETNILFNNEFIAVTKNDDLIMDTENTITSDTTEADSEETTEAIESSETMEDAETSEMTEETESDVEEENPESTEAGTESSTEESSESEESIEQTEEPEEIVSGNSITLDSYGRPINPYLRAAITKGNVTYTYSGGTLTITGNGTVTNGWQSYDTAWAGCVEKVTKVVFNSIDITSVNTDAFEGCSKLTTVNITACGWSNTGSTIACFRDVKTIRTVTVGKLGNLNNYMFQGCSGITAVTIADGGITCIPAYCFDMCTSLSSISLPKGVTEGIKEYAFRYCGLRTVTLNIENDANAIIGEKAFYACESLTNIRYATGTDANGATTYANNTLRAAIKSIGNYAFYGCNALTTINTGTGVTSIGNCAFMNCYNLNTLTIGTGVTTIGDFAFVNAPLKTRITYNAIDCTTHNSNFQRKDTANIVIGNKVTKIPSYLFQYCNEVTTVTFSGTSVCTEIGDYAFYNCYSLTNIKDNGTNNKIPDSVKTIGREAFDNCAFTTINTGTGVTAIKAYAFDRCDALTTVTIGTGVTTIESGAFDDVPLVRVNFNAIDCTETNNAFANIDTIETIVIGNKVTQIPPLLFYNNTSATTVTFTATSVCKKIGLSAFYGCTKLTIKDGGTANRIPESVKEIEDYAFYNCSSLEKLTIGTNVTSIGYNSFRGSTPLTELAINSDIINHNNAFKEHVGIQTLKFGSKCTTIYESMFEGCTGITSLDCGTGVTTVETKAFMGCLGLCDFGPTTKTSVGSIIYPRAATSVGKYAFRCYGNNDDSAQVPTATVSQSVSWYDKANRIAKVNLNVSATTPSIDNSKDYMLIVDTSGSMGEKITLSDGTKTNLMEVAKSSLKTIVEEIAKENSQNRVCIVAMGKVRANVFVFWRNLSSDNVEYIKNLIDTGMNYDNYITDTVPNTRSWGESKSGNAQRMWYNNPDTSVAQTCFTVAERLALRAIQTKGTNNNVYSIFISDGEPNDPQYVQGYSNDFAGAVEDVWSIAIGASNDNQEKYMKMVATSDDKYTNIPKNANLLEYMQKIVSKIQDETLICAKNATLNEVLNTTYWEVYNENGLSNKNGTLSKTGLSLDPIAKTYSYYIRLKDAYKNTSNNYLVSNNVNTSYSIYGSLNNGQYGSASNTTPHYLDWLVLTVNPNGGAWNNSATIQYFQLDTNAIKTIPVPTRSGHLFSGWTLAGAGSTMTSLTATSTFKMGTAGAVLTANWKQIPNYTVTYNGNGATSGTVEPQTFQEGGSVKIKENGFVRTEYEFTGWNTRADGTGTSYITGATYSTNANLTLYAQWKLTKIDIPVKVIWYDRSNDFATRPDKVTLLLMNGDTEAGRVILKGNNTVPAAADEWNYTFKGVDKYDSAGREIKYSLVEAMTNLDGSIVKDYVPCLRGELAYGLTYGADGLSVINKAEVMPTDEKYGVTVSGTVKWLDENDKYHFRPDSVEVILLQNGKEIDRKTLKEGTTEYRFAGLKFLDADGQPYEYSVIEEYIDNYKTAYDSKKNTKTETDSAGNTITTDSYVVNITNTFTPDKDTEKIQDNQLTMKTTFLKESGETATEEDFKKISSRQDAEMLQIVLKQMNLTWEPVKEEEGKYAEAYHGYSGNEINLLLTGTKITTAGYIPYGKYEIIIQKESNFTFRDIEELSTKNVLFSYENGKYYVTYSYAYEEAKEDLNVNMIINAGRGYTSETKVMNFFKIK